MVTNDPLILLEQCELCPRRCSVCRVAGKPGYCGAGGRLRVAHYGPHHGEEPPISGSMGSGNVFFSFCNLRCLFCQNHQISHGGLGKDISVEELVNIFFDLRDKGCHNINLVSPTPYIPLIALAINKAKRQGIGIPFVYNTNAYENVEALKVLEGLVDIYLPDFKYWSGHIAERLSGVPVGKDYAHHARLAVMEMKRQVGNLVIRDGLAQKGILIRHLVLPGGLAGSGQVIAWIREVLGSETYMSLMSQYYPLYNAGLHPMLRRRVRRDEYDRLIAQLIESGFENVFIQELDSAPLFVPDFFKAEPFEKQQAGKTRQTVQKKTKTRTCQAKGGRYGVKNSTDRYPRRIEHHYRPVPFREDR